VQTTVSKQASGSSSASYGRNLWMSPWHESAAYLPP
jgi:hypothetical protein